MNQRDLSFGPWSTALDAAQTSTLSRFWRRRLASLAQGASTATRLTRASRALLLAVAAAAIAFPTLERVGAQSATAQDQPRQPTAEAPAEAGKQPAWPVPPAATPASAPRPLNPRPPVEYLPRPSAQELRLQEALQEPSNIDVTEMPLADTMEYLQTLHSHDDSAKAIIIQFDRSALADAAVGLDAPVTARAQNIRLESVLRLVLSQHNLAYVVVDDVLKITTRDAADSMMFVRTYPVGDLVAPHHDFDSLIDTLTLTIAPENWDDVGGPASISAVPAAASLVVRQTYESHVRILELLRTLREARAIAAEAGIPSPPPNAGMPGRERAGRGGFGGAGGGFF